MPSPALTFKFIPAASLALTPLQQATPIVFSPGAAPSTWDATQISSILSTLLLHLPPVAKTASTSVIPPPSQEISLMP